MNNFLKIYPLIITMTLTAGLMACSVPVKGTDSLPAIATSAESDPISTTELLEHQIGVRIMDGVGEFYDKSTGEKFIPRGNNYVRLDPQSRDGGFPQIYHSVFDPAYYDSEEVIQAFTEMQMLGYNSVRVFISQNTIVTTYNLDPAYMQNIIDFLNLAKEHSLFVIFTLDWVPGGKYGEILSRDCCENFNNYNASTLPAAGLEANKKFFQDFIKYLIDKEAPLDTIFSFQLRNELFYEMNVPPLSLKSGIVEGANGVSYDMANADDKTRMADENMVFWINALRDAIIELDPTALVSVGFFWPQEPNLARIGDPRYINTAPAIWETSLDFIDLHAYPASELNLEEYAQNFGIEAMQEKPIIMGEFGIATFSIPSVDNAASILMNWQADSCKYGFDGWLLWTWDIYENNDFYNAKSGSGQIGEVLAPVHRPDPCEIKNFDFLETNIALNKKVTSSNFLPDQPATNIVDGTGAQWGSGEMPTQWIQIDLGQSYKIKLIRLAVGQYPEGNTLHEVYMGSNSSNLKLVHKFEEFTKEGQIIVFEPDSALQDIQFIRIVTTKSPSWVAWKEIEVISP